MILGNNKFYTGIHQTLVLQSLGLVTTPRNFLNSNWFSQIYPLYCLIHTDIYSLHWSLNLNFIFIAFQICAFGIYFYTIDIEVTIEIARCGTYRRLNFICNLLSWLTFLHLYSDRKIWVNRVRIKSDIPTSQSSMNYNSLFLTIMR